MITIADRTQTMQLWCDEFKISKHVVSKRIKAGWEPERAISTPANAGRLTPEDRDAVVAKVLAGESIRAIAEEFGIKKHTVYAACYRTGHDPSGRTP